MPDFRNMEMAFAGRPPPSWTTDEVCAFLEALELGQLKDIFRAHEVSGQVLISLSEDDMETKLGIRKFGWRRTLALGLSQLSRLNNGAPAVDASQSLRAVPVATPSQLPQIQQHVVERGGSGQASELWRAQSAVALSPSRVRPQSAQGVASVVPTPQYAASQASLTSSLGVNASLVRQVGQPRRWASPHVREASANAIVSASSPRGVSPRTRKPMPYAQTSLTSLTSSVTTPRRYVTPPRVCTTPRRVGGAAAYIQRPATAVVATTGAATVVASAPLLTAEPFPEPHNASMSRRLDVQDSELDTAANQSIIGEDAELQTAISQGAANDGAQTEHRLIVLRHGERLDCADPAKWFASVDAEKYPFDCPLTAEGHAEAERISKDIANGSGRVALVVSSPYIRCIETASHLAAALGSPLALDAEFGEVHGPHTMGPVSETPRHRTIDQLAAYVKPGVRLIRPQGGWFGKWPEWPEGLEEGRLRMLARFETYAKFGRQWGRSLAIVTHGDGVAAVLARLLRCRKWAIPGEVVRRVGYCAWLEAVRDIAEGPNSKSWTLARTANVDIGVVRATEGVVVNGPHEALNGCYLLLPGTQHEGRGVFQRAGGPEARLFYHGGGGWMISDKVGADCGWACCMDNAASPTAVKSHWCIWDGKVWTEAPGLSICEMDSQGAMARGDQGPLDPRPLDEEERALDAYGGRNANGISGSRVTQQTLGQELGVLRSELRQSIRCDAEVAYGDLAAAAEAHGPGGRQK